MTEGRETLSPGHIYIKATKKETTEIAVSFGAPEGTRTPDLLVRSQTLYPAELLAQRALVREHIDYTHLAGKCQEKNSQKRRGREFFFRYSTAVDKTEEKQYAVAVQKRTAVQAVTNRTKGCWRKAG